MPVCYDKTTTPTPHLRPTTDFIDIFRVRSLGPASFCDCCQEWPQDIVVLCCGLYSTFGYVCGHLIPALSSIGANEINVYRFCMTNLGFPSDARLQGSAAECKMGVFTPPSLEDDCSGRACGPDEPGGDPGGPGGEEQCPDGGSGARTVREPKTPAWEKG